MTVVPFDTLALARKLRDDAKMTQEQAEGIAKALAEAMSGADVATRADLAPLATKVDLESIKSDILKSVMSLLLTVVTINAAVVMGAMFGVAKLLGH